MPNNTLIVALLVAILVVLVIMLVHGIPVAP